MAHDKQVATVSRTSRRRTFKQFNLFKKYHQNGNALPKPNRSLRYRSIDRTRSFYCHRFSEKKY